jgi:SCY1-like protein 2
MGNSVAKKFDIPKEHTASAGHLRLWKIWPGKAKESNKAGNTVAGQLVSVWTFDKSELLKQNDKKGSGMDKNVVEQIYQIMKRDLAVMKDSQASPQMISSLEVGILSPRDFFPIFIFVHQVIEESKNGIAFTTERIICSLADIFYNFEGIVSGKLAHTEFFDDGDTVSEVEISRAFLTLTEGLQYMHNVQRRFHMNLNPENIVITASGQWKLCGFGLSLTYQQGDQQRIASPYFLKPSTNPSAARLEPDARYSAPEVSEGGYNPTGVRYVSASADMFSLGLVMYEIYKFNLKLSSYERSSFRPMVAIMNNDINHHYSALEGSLRQLDVAFLPSGIDRLITGLLSLNLSYRLGALDVTSSQYFITGNMGTLNAIENLSTRDLGTQTSQLMSLVQQVNKFPTRLIKFIILPSVGKLCLNNATLWEYSLPLFRLISRLIPNDLYRAIAGNYIAAGLGNNSCNESMLAFLAFVPFILESFDPLFFQVIISCNFCLITISILFFIDSCDNIIC